MVAVDICNLALSYLGDSATVASIDPPEGSAQAQHCARFYPMALAIMLENHEWNFITKRVTLALLTTPYNDRWQYAYAVPSNSNSILSVIPKCEYADYFGFRDWLGWRWAYPFESEKQRWKDFQIEVDAQNRRVILSNLCDAIARFTTNQVTPGMFPAMFTNALARLLASMLAGPILKGNEGISQGQKQFALYRLQLGEAEAQDANQRHDAPEARPVWMYDR